MQRKVREWGRDRRTRRYETAVNEIISSSLRPDGLSSVGDRLRFEGSVADTLGIPIGQVRRMMRGVRGR